MDSEGLDTVLKLFTFGGIFSLAFTLVIIVFAVVWFLYEIITAIAHYRTMKIFGYENPWMAFIPYLSTYVWIENCMIKSDGVKLKKCLFPEPLIHTFFVIWVVYCSMLPFVPLGVPLSIIIMLKIVLNYVTGYHYWRLVFGYESSTLALINALCPIIQKLALLFHKYAGKNIGGKASGNTNIVKENVYYDTSHKKNSL